MTLGMLGLVLAPATASAQYRPAETAAVGENYHFEAAWSWWNAEPTLSVNSESLGIIGTEIDLISDLGIERHNLGMLNLTLKPARKHRLRFQRLPITYETDAFPVTRSFIFNGQVYRVGLPVSTSVDFTTYSFGYQYDFLYFPRWFVGAGVNLKYTNVDVNLASPIGTEFLSVTAPIPAISFGGRGYVTRNFAIDAEMAIFRVPDGIAEQLEGDGSYTDFDLHGTYNFTKYVGAQMGWRRTRIFYDVDLDTGDLFFKGFYFGGVVRY